jgi:PTH1 family peptidyl-tRNA hydrolase
MKVVIGLGNPGEKYRETRHNIGFKVVDALAARKKARFRRGWGYCADIAKYREGDETVWLVKPKTFMNRSGETVAAFLKKRRVALEDVIVVCDDIDLDWQRIRVRAKGSGGSHNGMKSILAATDSSKFPRIRVGVGRPEPGEGLIEFVLGSFSDSESGELPAVVAAAADAAECVIHSGAIAAMNQFNSK